MVLGELRGPRRAERVRYRRFVEEGLLREIENPFEAVRWQAVLGDESLVQNFWDRIKGCTSSNGKSPRYAWPCLQRIRRRFWRVAEKYRLDRKRLVARGERGLHARNVAMWMLWESGTKTLRELGEVFGGLDYAAVAQRIRRTKSSHNAIAAKRLIATMLNV